MKKCEIRMRRAYLVLGLRAGRRRRGAARLLLRRHLLARPHAHQAVDDDAVVGVEAVLDDAQIAVDQRAERDVFLRAVFSAPTTSTNLRTCSVPIAASGTSSAS